MYELKFIKQMDRFFKFIFSKSLERVRKNLNQLSSRMILGFSDKTVSWNRDYGQKQNHHIPLSRRTPKFETIAFAVIQVSSHFRKLRFLYCSNLGYEKKMNKNDEVYESPYSLLHCSYAQLF